MNVIEGKMVVLRPYLTETQCVKPQSGQAATYAVPVECNPGVASAAGCVSGTTDPVETRSPVECVPKTVQTEDTIAWKHCIRDTEPMTVPQALRTEQAVARPLQTVQVHTVSATPELGKMLDGASSDISRTARKKWFADALLHMTEE